MYRDIGRAAATYEYTVRPACAGGHRPNEREAPNPLPKCEEPASRAGVPPTRPFLCTQYTREKLSVVYQDTIKILGNRG